MHKIYCHRGLTERKNWLNMVCITGKEKIISEAERWGTEIVQGTVAVCRLLYFYRSVVRNFYLEV